MANCLSTEDLGASVLQPWLGNPCFYDFGEFTGQHIFSLAFNRLGSQS